MIIHITPAGTAAGLHEAILAHHVESRTVSLAPLPADFPDLPAIAAKDVPPSTEGGAGEVRV